jgi:hypothetical protein
MKHIASLSANNKKDGTIMKITKYIVSSREGTELRAPKVFNTEKEAADDIYDELVRLSRDCLIETYGEDSCELKEFDELIEESAKTGSMDELVEFMEDEDLISGFSFISSGDWTEFEITPVEIELTDDDMTAIMNAGQAADRRKENQEKANANKHLIGKRFQHFKGSVYVIDNIAIHSETSELRVIYHSEENPSYVWDRNYDMFFSPVDKVKYPNVKQEMRFQLLD